MNALPSVYTGKWFGMAQASQSHGPSVAQYILSSSVCGWFAPAVSVSCVPSIDRQIENIDHYDNINII